MQVENFVGVHTGVDIDKLALGIWLKRPQQHDHHANYTRKHTYIYGIFNYCILKKSRELTREIQSQ